MGTLSPTRQDMSLMASVGVPHRVPTTLLVSGLLTLQAASGKPVEVDVSVNVNTQPKQPMGSRSGRILDEDCIERGVQYFGYYTTTSAIITDKPDFNSCGLFCYEVPGCDKWSWKPSSELRGGCFLFKSKYLWKKESPDWISGSVGCNNRRLQEGSK